MKVITKPCFAKAIYFKGNTKPLQDCYICVVENFLVVGKHAEDNSPTWYNLDKVERMEEVSALPETRTEKKPRLFYY